jgi:hypothetical protein
MMQAHQNGIAVVGRWVYKLPKCIHDALSKQRTESSVILFLLRKDQVEYDSDVGSSATTFFQHAHSGIVVSSSVLR